MEEQEAQTDFEQEHVEQLVHDGVCEHYFVESKDQDNNDLLQIQCTKCPLGASINEEQYLHDGKICQLKI